jgi:hypothetical protein
MLITLEIVLLLGFQILAGFLYNQLALIVSFFMTGMALGAAMVSWCVKQGVGPALTRSLLIMIQFLIGLFALGNIGVLYLLQHLSKGGEQWIPLAALFSILAFAGGALGGGHFCLAVKVMSGLDVPSVRIGGGLYALDLLGSALGALTACLFILPLYGLTVTMVVFAALCFTSLLVLMLSFNTVKLD